MLHMAFNHSPGYSFFTGDILVKSILNVIDQEDLVNIIKEKNNDGDTILHLAAKKGLIVFNTVMAPIPEENVFDGIKEQNNDGNTVLHLVIKNWFKNDLGKIASTWLYAPIFNSGYLPNKHQNKVLDKLLTSLSPEQLLYLFNQKNNSQEDILDIAETVSATLHQKLLDILESILDVAETVSATLYKNLFDRFCNSVVTPNYLKLTAKPNF